MKKLNCAAMLVALALTAVTVYADDQGERKDAEPVVKTRVFSKVITIGPDGEVKVQEQGGDLKDLPEEIRKLVEVPVKEAATAGDDDEEKTPSARRVLAVDTKILKLGPDGKLEEMKGADGVPKAILERIKKATDHGATVQGSITVIGPDGKRHTRPLGDGSLDGGSISIAIGEALKGAGRELPEEVQENLRKAMKNLAGAIKIEAKIAPTPRGGALSKKLDVILERLEKLEREVKGLKKRQK